MGTEPTSVKSNLSLTKRKQHLNRLWLTQQKDKLLSEDGNNPYNVLFAYLYLFVSDL